MNIDAQFFYCLLRDEDPMPLAHVPREWFHEPWVTVYDFVRECLSSPKMKRLPQIETVIAKFGVEFMETAEDLGFYVEELCKRKTRLEVEELIRDVAIPLIESPSDPMYNPAKAAQVLLEGSAEITRRNRRSYDQHLDYWKDVKVRIDILKKRQAQKGLTGIPYPFDPLNYATGGLIDGELTVFLGASGIGKSWFLALTAMNALKLNYPGAIFSQEMRPRELSLRLDLLGAGVAPQRAWDGSYREHEWQKLRDYYHAITTEEKPYFQLFGPSDVRSLADFEATLASIRPKISWVAWDSPYLLCRGEKWELRADFVRTLKALAEDYNIPIFVTWQLNSDGEPAYTRAVYTDADHNFKATEDRDLRQLRISSTKTRDGLHLESLLLKWDLYNGEFGTIGFNIPGFRDSSQDTRASWGPPKP